MKVFYLYTWMMLTAYASFAQHTPVQMIPQTPAAYSLGKYGDIPVSLYTGVPNISVPIYTLKDHDASVDISLSYHGSGIKVDEIASFAGLGWSLNAGGVITRVVRGKAETLLIDGSLSPKRSDIQFYDHFQHPATSDHIHDNHLYAAANGQLDNEPNLFYFNFMGRSGKFVFDKNGQVVLENKAGLDIKWKFVNGYDLQNFTIRDEMGNTYEFADYETTFYPEDYKNMISAWYLSKLTSPTGNVINFVYTGAASSNQLTRSYTTSLVTVHPYNTSVTPPLDVPYYGTGFSEIRLERIKGEYGEVEFVYKSERRKDYAKLDFTNAASSALEEIRIYKPDKSLLRKFALYTSYFEANDAEKYDGRDPEIYDYLNYRLRLDAVQEYASDNSTHLPPYRFTYSGDDDPLTDDPYTLPYRLSPSQDHWGFYNQAYNTHMIPGSSVVKGIAIPAWYRQFSPPDGPEYVHTVIDGGANREPNPQAVKAGMITKMQYPTGGHTSFDFESNDYINNIPGVRIKNVVHHPVAGEPVETSYAYQGYSQYNPRNYYFEAYLINHFYGEISPRPSTLQQFGLPSDPVYGVEQKKYIKVVVQPQAILGHGSEVGYNLVTVSQPGKGSVTSIFTNQDRFRDYVDRDYMDEYSIGELNMLDRLFYSEYIDDMSSPDAPYGNVRSKTLSSQEWPYPEIYSNAWKRGLLSDRYTRSATNIMLKEEHFDYYHQLLQAVPGFKVIMLPNASNQYVYSKYFVPGTWSKPKSVEVKEYDQNGLHPLTSNTHYYYDNMAHMQATRIVRSRSDGRTETSYNTFPLDYATGTTFLDDMKARHLLSYPVEQVKYLGGPYPNGIDHQIVSGSITRYKEGGKGLKDQEFELETSSPIVYTNFDFSNRPAGWYSPWTGYSKFAPDARYKPRIGYNGYDAKSNLTGYALDHNMNISYKWGFNFQYPVAEVKNASASEYFYTSFEDDGMLGVGHTGNRFHDGDYWVEFIKPNDRFYEISYWYRAAGKWVYSGLQPYTKAILITAGDAIDDIRVCPVEAQMTTYTYDPLIGMTSQTDARDNTTYYEYDGFGRLRLVRDDDGNIIRKICYGYGGEPESCSIAKFVPPNKCGPCESEGPEKKCINDICESGRLIVVSSVKIDRNTYECKYYYEWSDGSSSRIITRYYNTPCLITIK